MQSNIFKRGLALLKNLDLLELGAEADRVRRRIHPDNVVTFINDRNINYTNICTGRCRFCAFHRVSGENDSYLLSYQQVGNKIDEAKALGAVQILLQGGLHPELGIDWYQGLLRYIKKNHPIHIHGFSAPEIDHICRVSKIDLDTALSSLIDAGLDSIPGGGAEILCSRVRRRLSPRKISVKRWLRVHETAHGLGIRTTATLVYGMGETIEELLVHLSHIYRLQERTGGFTAFIPWSFQPSNTRLDYEKTGPARYLRVLAASRVLLDNVPNIQASWITQGPDIAQLSLSFGANDFGSTMLEENVVRAAGCVFNVMNERKIAKLIRKAGFDPALRTQDYRITKRF
ncbi:cyclic dehypoxanthinyl futalosine synthase [Gemmatimonadota bacterium]